MARGVVTGATGFIAGHVVLQLLDAGHEVVGTERSASKAEALNKTFSDYAGRPFAAEIRAAGLGPVMGRDFPASVEILTQLMPGKLPGAPRVGFVIVDMRDVAAAHVLAMTAPEADRQHFLVGDRFLAWQPRSAEEAIISGAKSLMKFRVV